jgi:hypothetical protein
MIHCPSQFAKHCSLTLLGLSFSVACSSDPIDLGEQPLVVDRSALEAYVAEWDGYIEGTPLENSGSDRIHLVIDHNGDGSLSFGEEAAPAGLDNVGVLFSLLFPPNIGADALSVASGSAGRPPYPIEGFEYTFRAAIVEQQRIRLASRLTEAAEGVCSAQSPVQNVAFPEGSSLTEFTCGAQASWELDQSCYPGLTLTQAADIIQQPNPDFSLLGDPTGCQTSAICQAYCICTASACSAIPQAEVPSYGGRITLDAALESDGSRLTGTLNWGLGNYTVRFTRF